MILTTHLLAGTAIGSKIHNVWLVFFIGLALHYVFDALPHWEYDFNYEGDRITNKNVFFYAIKVTVDLLIGVVLVLFLTKNSPFFSSILWGVIGCALPDGLVFLYDAIKKIFGYDSKILRKLYQFHHDVHIPKNKNSLVWGTLLELLIIVFSLYFLIH